MKRMIVMLFLLVLLAACERSEPIVAPPLPEAPTIPTDPGVSEEAETTEAPLETGLSTGSPVEQLAPNTDYQPAFAGQTRIGSIQTEATLDVTVLTNDLDAPWGVAVAPDGRFFITERLGNLRILTPEGTLSEPIRGFPDVASDGQGGLLDIAFSPTYPTDRRIYFTLAEQTADGAVTAVGHGVLSRDETMIEDFTIIYRALPYYSNSAHFGSRIVFVDDGTLFVSTGDRQSNATRMQAQSLDNGYGKIIHLTPEGEAVEQLFPNLTGALPEIYSYGHRNVQGMAIDPETGDLWIAEMGPRGGDELNLILPGRNYGWPLVSYGIEYSGAKVLDGLTQLEGTEQPVYYWDPVLAPGGMTFYTGDLLPEWQGNLFIGGLKGSHIARLVLKDRRVVAEERLLADLGERFRDVTVGPDGALYTITDSGRLYRLATK